MTDELAELRAAKGIVTIKIVAGDASVVRHVKTKPLPPRKPRRRFPVEPEISDEPTEG